MLKNDWQLKTNRWGHPLHSMCSYMGSFPPSLPHYFIQKFTRRGDVVLDPFCGRGTGPLQACVEGRIGIGIDPNPLAYSLTAAKVIPPDLTDLRNRIDDLSNDMFFASIDNEPLRIRMLFHPDTLRQLVYLKQTLHHEDQTDAFIIAVVLGILYGNTSGGKGKGTSLKAGSAGNFPPFLAIPMPNLLSMAPSYVERYIQDKNLEAPYVDVFGCLRQRLNHLLRFGVPQTPGRVWKSRIQELADIPDPALKRKKVKLIISSPPCLKAQRYGLYNWIRLWFLNEDHEELDARLDQHHKLKDYLLFMQDACRILYRTLAPGGICAFAISDVLRKNEEEPIRLAEEVWKHLQRKRTRFHLAEILSDTLPGDVAVDEKYGEDAKPKAVAIDRVLVLYKDSYEELVEHVAW